MAIELNHPSPGGAPGIQSAGDYHTVDPFYQFESGARMVLPLDAGGPPWYMIYYIIVGLFLVPAVSWAGGRPISVAAQDAGQVSTAAAASL
jgi:hypothetical protein